MQTMIYLQHGPRWLLLSIPDGRTQHHSRFVKIEDKLFVRLDTIYFVLPSLDEKNRSVFGVACYRQIETSSLISKDGRSNKKSCSRSLFACYQKCPCSGVLTAKLELITQAYFNEKDFSQVQVLKTNVQLFVWYLWLLNIGQSISVHGHYTDSAVNYFQLPVTWIVQTSIAGKTGYFWSERCC